jgi:hypothetical protein
MNFRIYRSNSSLDELNSWCSVKKEDILKTSTKNTWVRDQAGSVTVVSLCRIAIKVHPAHLSTESANARLNFQRVWEFCRQASSHGAAVVWQPGRQVDNTVEGGQGLHPRRSPVLPIPLPSPNPIHLPASIYLHFYLSLKSLCNLHTEEMASCSNGY